jgi:hydrogenase expression/formation protein HypC
MCLALPARVVALDRDAELATVEMDGVKKEVSLALIDDVAVGDYLLIHVGYALQRLSEQEAMRTLALFDELEASRTMDTDSA